SPAWPFSWRRSFGSPTAARLIIGGGPGGRQDIISPRDLASSATRERTMATDYGMLPTTVIGSHAIPSWLWTALEAIEQDKYGPTDVRETFDDAVNAAILDQERAGVDVITDGEMRRWYFVQSFYKRFTGLDSVGVLRKVGVYGYDSAPRYRPVERLTVPNG